METQPNIIIFFTDQQRWDTCGCYGQPLQITPHLDRMAREGTRFEYAFTSQPVCGPARACIQTGKYPETIGCPTNHRRLPPHEKTIAHHLAHAGYETAYIGKWHLASCGEHNGPDDFRTLAVPTDRRGGYNDFWLASDALEHTSHSYDGHMFDTNGNRRDFPPGRYRADAQTDWVLEYLASRSPTHPFLLFVSYIEPHHQNDHHHYEGPAGSKERFRDFSVPGDLANTDGDWAQEYPDYLGCVSALDNNLGRLLSFLQRRGIDDNTLLIFTSDHGSHFRTRNAEYKRSCHDACIRIPLVLRGPGFPRGVSTPRFASIIDMAPTILTAAGVAVPSDMVGRPLQSALSDANTQWPDEVFLQITEHQCGRAIRTRRWKYSVRDHSKTGWGEGQTATDTYTEDCLYDLSIDPNERHNLVRDPGLAGMRARLADTLRRRMVEAGETAPAIIPAGG